MRGALLFFGMFAAFGLGLMYLTWYLADESLHYAEYGIRAAGVVTGLERRSDSDGTTYYPEVRFTTDEGDVIEFVGNTGASPPAFDVDEAVEILYLPENPYDARIDAFFSMWGGALICGVLGGIFASIGLGFMGAAVRSRRREVWLRQHGHRMAVDISHVNEPEGKRRYYTIHAQWHNPRDGKMYLFKSAPLYFDPKGVSG